MLASYASLVLRDPRAGRRLPPIPAERASEPAGYGSLADLSAAAPAPARRLHEVRQVPRSLPGEGDRPPALPARRDPRAARASRATGGGALGAAGDSAARRRCRRGVVETIWSCMQCNACVEICPVGIEQAPIINQLRRRAARGGRARRRPAGDPADDPQNRELARREPAPARQVDRGARLRGPRRARGAGRRALVRRRLRLLRPALPARHQGACPGLPRGRARVRDPL